MSTTRVCPSDEKAAKAWDKIMDIAREHCLVTAAYGGVATLAIPDEQRSAGLRDKVLAMHRATEADPSQHSLFMETAS